MMPALPPLLRGELIKVDGVMFYLLKVEALGDHTVLHLSADGEWRASHKLHGTEDTTMKRDPRTRGWVVTGAILEEVQ